ncbi:unnamed protein product [Thelazia callipaeda]|uniref:DUF148 domain-containing protein n=1 Tax=Thelazia callipaeda TaxID=103827 RepID=A0A0N5CLM9_THECL|nr:unnamed protein product [Thelazia callipaeda]
MKVFILISLFVAYCIAQQNMVPPFLIGQPAAVVQDFHQILLTAVDKTDMQMEQAIENWISRQSATVKAAFDKFKKEAIAAAKQAEQQRQTAIASLSPAARQADAQLTAIATSSTLTGRQKQQQIQQILAGISDAVKQELQNTMQG